MNSCVPHNSTTLHRAWSGSGQKGHKRQHTSNASWLTKDGFGRQDSVLDWLDAKGQLISKGFCGILNSPKKQYDFTTMIPQADLFSFAF